MKETLDFKESSNDARASKMFKILLSVGLIGGATLGTTFASNISLNGDSNVEFGQGVIQTVACDSSINITPVSTFINSENTNSHLFSGITISNIDSNVGMCDGKDFIIKAYSSSGISDIFENSGTSFNTLRVYDDAGTFYLVSEGSDQIEIESGQDNSSDPINTSFSITFSQPVARAEDIEKVTVESVDHDESSLISFGSHLYQLVDSPLSWDEAYADITTEVNGRCKYVHNGMCGYFANITSDAERLAVISNVGDSAIWLGGSDKVVEGEWRWVDGPEFGQKFSQSFYTEENDVYGNTYFAVDYTNTVTYDHWNSGEPNDSGENEDALQTLAGVGGLWNDLPTTGWGQLPYLIEYSPNFRSRTQRLS